MVLGYQNPLSGQFYLSNWWNAVKLANQCFWYNFLTFFKFWPCSVLRGTPVHIFFRFFLSQKFLHPFTFFLRKRPVIEFTNKKVRKFGYGGVYRTPLSLAGVKICEKYGYNVYFEKEDMVWQKLLKPHEQFINTFFIFIIFLSKAKQLYCCWCGNSLFD